MEDKMPVFREGLFDERKPPFEHCFRTLFSIFSLSGAWMGKFLRVHPRGWRGLRRPWELRRARERRGGAPGSVLEPGRVAVGAVLVPMAILEGYWPILRDERLYLIPNDPGEAATGMRDEVV